MEVKLPDKLELIDPNSDHDYQLLADGEWIDSWDIPLLEEMVNRYNANAQLRASNTRLRAQVQSLVEALDDVIELADTLYPYKPIWFEYKSKYDWVQEDIITKAQQALAKARRAMEDDNDDKTETS